MTHRPSLPPETCPRSVRLQVSNLTRAREWYTTVLGCRVLQTHATEVHLGAEDDAVPLIVLEERPGTRPTRPYTRLGLYHVALLLPSRAALGAFVRHLADQGIAAASADHLVSEALYLTDPDGLGIEVYADRPRTEWTYARGDVVMAVDPLDLRALATAARAPWTGLPSGTTVGHLHLHVGDLAAASAFYVEGLGLHVMARFQGAVFLAAGGYHHHLAVNTWATGAQPAGGNEARLLEWVLLVPDPASAQTAAARLAAAGHMPETAAEGVWVVTDPWGTRLRVTC